MVPELPCKRPHPVASENSSLGDPQRSGSSETCEKPAKLQNVFDLEEVLMASASQLEKDEENVSTTRSAFSKLLELFVTIRSPEGGRSLRMRFEINSNYFLRFFPFFDTGG